ncbi:Hypothetical predicted protein, partial [Olea europaea subsp. europaea]
MAKIPSFKRTFSTTTFIVVVAAVNFDVENPSLWMLFRDQELQFQLTKEMPDLNNLELIYTGHFVVAQTRSLLHTFRVCSDHETVRSINT